MIDVIATRDSEGSTIVYTKLSPVFAGSVARDIASVIAETVAKKYVSENYDDVVAKIDLTEVSRRIVERLKKALE